MTIVDPYQEPSARNGVFISPMLDREGGRKSGRKTMVCRNPRCVGNYDFDRIAFFARKRFIEGHDTVTLLEHAESEREKEEIALVCLLDVEDDKIRDLQLSCRHAGYCKVTDCRDRLKKMIEKELTH